MVGGVHGRGGMHVEGHEWQGGGMHGMGACMTCTPLSRYYGYGIR